MIHPAAIITVLEHYPPTLRIGDYVLRPFKPADAAAWYEYLADPRVTEHTSWPVVTPDFVATLVARLIDDYATAKSMRWAIARVSDDRLVGACGYSRWSTPEGTAELAYDLSPAYWRRGIMKAAVEAAVGWALSTGVFHRIEALAMTTNQASIGLLERAGFQREQLLKDHRMARGTLRDFYLYSRCLEAPADNREPPTREE
jgi:[ribosomal protein S5]-alanine N-acetyltransferase